MAATSSANLPFFEKQRAKPPLAEVYFVTDDLRLWNDAVALHMGHQPDFTPQPFPLVFRLDDSLGKDFHGMLLLLRQW
jgi:hypothetical protein